MDLGKKRALAARTLKVGKERIFFVPSRLDEVKEAMTKQDIRDLHKEKAILIRDIKGRRIKIRKKKKKGDGNKKKNIKNKKKTYMILTRKLRKDLGNLKSQGKISKEESKEIRKRIRNKAYRSKAHFRLQLGEIKR
ncbi:MAG: 50S ribosomal protein L19e [archaeon]